MAELALAARGQLRERDRGGERVEHHAVDSLRPRHRHGLARIAAQRRGHYPQLQLRALHDLNHNIDSPYAAPATLSAAPPPPGSTPGRASRTRWKPRHGLLGNTVVSFTPPPLPTTPLVGPVCIPPD